MLSWATGSRIWTAVGAAVGAVQGSDQQMGKPAWIAIDHRQEHGGSAATAGWRRMADREYLKAPSELMDVVEEGTLLIVVDTHSKTIIEIPGAV